MPALLLLLLTGARVLRDALPGGQTAEAAFTAGLCALCVATLPELNALWDPARHPELVVTDETFPSPLMRVVHDLVDRYNGPPALVLFPYKPGDPLYEEPVYNTQTAWPDDARVVLAHDLGPVRDREIFAYYARTPLGRLVYRFDRNAARPEDKLVELGDARTLADQGPAR